MRIPAIILSACSLIISAVDPSDIMNSLLTAIDGSPDDQDFENLRCIVIDHQHQLEDAISETQSTYSQYAARSEQLWLEYTTVTDGIYLAEKRTAECREQRLARIQWLLQLYPSLVGSEQLVPLPDHLIPLVQHMLHTMAPLGAVGDEVVTAFAIDLLDMQSTYPELTDPDVLNSFVANCVSAFLIQEERISDIRLEVAYLRDKLSWIAVDMEHNDADLKECRNLLGRLEETLSKMRIEYSLFL
jgi:hypothetical protein